MTQRSEDQSLRDLLLDEGALGAAELERLLRRAAAEGLSLEDALWEEVAGLDQDKLSRALSRRSRAARLCSVCEETTYLLEGQRTTDTPCERCGGALRAPASARLDTLGELPLLETAPPRAGDPGDLDSPTAGPGPAPQVTLPPSLATTQGPRPAPQVTLPPPNLATTHVPRPAPPPPPGPATPPLGQATQPPPGPATPPLGQATQPPPGRATQPPPGRATRPPLDAADAPGRPSARLGVVADTVAPHRRPRDAPQAPPSALEVFAARFVGPRRARELVGGLTRRHAQMLLPALLTVSVCFLSLAGQLWGLNDPWITVSRDAVKIGRWAGVLDRSNRSSLPVVVLTGTRTHRLTAIKAKLEGPELEHLRRASIWVFDDRSTKRSNPLAPVVPQASINEVTLSVLVTGYDPDTGAIRTAFVDLLSERQLDDLEPAAIAAWLEQTFEERSRAPFEESLGRPR